MRITLACLLLLLSAWSLDAAAYIGPGAGISFLGSVWTVLVGIVLAIVAIVAWPLRLVWRRIRGKHRQQQDAPPPADEV